MDHIYTNPFIVLSMKATLASIRQLYKICSLIRSQTLSQKKKKKKNLYYILAVALHFFSLFFRTIISFNS